MTSFNPDVETPQRSIRSFVIRGGRMTIAQQQALERLWPRLGLELESGTLDAPQVFGNSRPVTLEIGFGMGDSLAQMASENPDQNFIGIEVHRPGVGRLLSLAEKMRLQNLRVYCADAIEVLERAVLPAALQRVNIFFPDPWHKKRHHKRRLIQQSFLDLLTPKLCVGGILHIATDWQPYAEEVLVLLQAQQLYRNAAVDSDCVGSLDYVNPLDYGRPQTKFERRGRELGHGVWDIAFRKQAG